MDVVLDDVIKIVDFLRSHSKEHRMFSKQCKLLETDAIMLLYYAEAPWLSRGKIVKRAFQLRQELRISFAQWGHPMSPSFKDKFCLRNCPISRKYFRTQIIVWIFRCKETNVTFLKLPIRFMRSKKVEVLAK